MLPSCKLTCGKPIICRWKPLAFHMLFDVYPRAHPPILEHGQWNFPFRAMIFPANEASIWFGDLPSRFDYPMIFPYISINHFYIMGYHWKYMMEYICGLFPYSSHDISYIIKNSINHIININYKKKNIPMIFPRYFPIWFFPKSIKIQ